MTWTEDDLARTVARLEANGTPQSPDVKAAVKAPAKAPRASQQPAQKAEGAPDAGSSLEVLFLDALKEYGLDLLPVVSQYEFAAPLRKFRFDYCWPTMAGRAVRVAVECDGGQHAPGGGRHNTDEDRFKLNLAAALGWRILRFSGSALKNDPEGCIALLRRALER